MCRKRGKTTISQGKFVCGVKKKREIPNGVTFAKPLWDLISNLTEFQLLPRVDFKPVILEFPDQRW